MTLRSSASSSGKVQALVAGLSLFCLFAAGSAHGCWPAFRGSDCSEPEEVGPLSHMASEHFEKTEHEMTGGIDGASRAVGATPGFGACNGSFCTQSGDMAGTAANGSSAVGSGAESRLKSAYRVRDKIVSAVDEGLDEGKYQVSDVNNLYSKFAGEKIPSKPEVDAVHPDLKDAAHGLRTVEQEIHGLKDTIRDMSQVTGKSQDLGRQMDAIAQQAKSLADSNSQATKTSAVAQYPSSSPGPKLAAAVAPRGPAQGGDSGGNSESGMGSFRDPIADNAGSGGRVPASDIALGSPADLNILAGASPPSAGVGVTKGRGPTTYYPRFRQQGLAGSAGPQPSAVDAGSPAAAKEAAADRANVKSEEAAGQTSVGAGGPGEATGEKPAAAAPGLPTAPAPIPGFNAFISAKGKLSEEGQLLMAGMLKNLSGDLQARPAPGKEFGAAGNELLDEENGNPSLLGKTILDITSEASALGKLSALDRDLFKRIHACIHRRGIQ